MTELYPADHPAFAPVLRAAKALAERGGPALVAIDGRCGAGKTALAAALARELGCAVVHTDDFYLPFARRDPAWQSTPAANMDFARLRAQVLDPLRAGRAASYRPYNCHNDTMGEARALPAGALTILEGSYSHHPDLGAYDLRVFVTCAPDEQARRLRAREGTAWPGFQARWIPLEEGYFHKWGIPAKADMVLDTGERP